MADRTAATAVSASLSSNIVDRIVLTGESVGEVIIFNRSGTQDIYVRIDGIDPVALGDNCHVVPSDTERRFGVNPGAVDVRLIGSGPAAYSVEAV